jgi:hypothetical protein
MEIDDNDMRQNFEIEGKNVESDVRFGSEIGNPPLVVVVQGGKNVKSLI